MGIFMLNMVTSLSGACMLLADNEKICDDCFNFH